MKHNLTKSNKILLWYISIYHNNKLDVLWKNIEPEVTIQHSPVRSRKVVEIGKKQLDSSIIQNYNIYNQQY